MDELVTWVSGRRVLDGRVQTTLQVGGQVVFGWEMRPNCYQSFPEFSLQTYLLFECFYSSNVRRL